MERNSCVRVKLEGGKMSGTAVTVRIIAYSYAVAQERARKVQVEAECQRTAVSFQLEMSTRLLQERNVKS